MNSELQQLLRTMPAEALAEIILDVFGISPDVDNRIESRLLSRDPAALARHINKRIGSIERGQRFIDYRESDSFSLELDGIVEDIEPLVESDPQAAFELADRFIASHSDVFGRADDSGGSIGASYRAGVGLWLRAASRLRRQQGEDGRIDWPQELHARHQENDYGIWDELISSSAELLTKDELERLARVFEAEITARGRSDAYDHKALTAGIGLAAVAEALADVPMYERSVLLRSPEPNELQKQSIAEFCLTVKDGEAALKWLVGPWPLHLESNRKRLLDHALSLLGRTQELIALRQEVYDANPDIHNLQALLDVLPEDQQARVQLGAVDKALHAGQLQTSVATLIELDALDLASSKILEQAGKLGSVFYGTLETWGKRFSRGGQYLAAVACYRALLEDILDAGRSKAYPHAARYYQQLAGLDARIADYHSVASREEYDALLRQKHGRKYSFWRQVGNG